MQRHVTRNTRYETLLAFADPSADNFRVIDPKDFRIVARQRDTENFLVERALKHSSISFHAAHRRRTH